MQFSLVACLGYFGYPLLGGCLALLAGLSFIWIHFNPAKGETTFSRRESKGFSLTGFVEKIMGSSKILVETAQYLNQNRESMGKGVNDQMGAVQLALASMSEMSTTAETSAELADSSLEHAKSVNERAQNGRAMIEKTVAAMRAIESTNVQLNAIVHLITEVQRKTLVIDDIMLQTKLLSFNAAIEAARAGEAGRGFQVVSDAMRELARMCSSAATEIRALVTTGKDQAGVAVEEINKKITEGRNITNEATENFRMIVDGVENISKNVETIYDSFRLQEVALVKCSESIARIYATSTSNRKISDQAEHRSAVLVTQSSELKEIGTSLDRIESKAA